MAKIYYEKDAHLENIADLAIGVIGYGNQGRAHALNLRDSGLRVRVGARSGGKAHQTAKDDHFDVTSVEDIATNCDVIAILLPDESMAEVYTNSIEPYISSSKTFVFAHGFAVHHNLIRLPDTSDILLVAQLDPADRCVLYLLQAPVFQLSSQCNRTSLEMVGQKLLLTLKELDAPGLVA